MTTRHTALLAGVLITGFSLAGVGGAGAQEADHLLCVTVKDDANLRGREDITIFATGCTVNVKAKTACFPVAKNGGDDTRGPALSTPYVCYDVQCDADGQNNTLALNTQFGPHVLTARKIKTICAPADSSF